VLAWAPALEVTESKGTQVLEQAQVPEQVQMLEQTQVLE
jgi:hypothetical protein